MARVELGGGGQQGGAAALAEALVEAQQPAVHLHAETGQGILVQVAGPGRGEKGVVRVVRIERCVLVVARVVEVVEAVGMVRGMLRCVESA